MAFATGVAGHPYEPTRTIRPLNHDIIRTLSEPTLALPRQLACQHTLSGHRGTILCLALSVDDRILFSGSQDTTIWVWSLDTFQCKHILRGHTRGVLCLTVHGNVLFSAGGDNVIRLWDLQTLHCIRVLEGFVGDVFSLAVVGSHLFAGCQDTTIKAVDLQWATGQVDPTELPLVLDVNDVKHNAKTANEHLGFIYCMCAARVGDPERTMLFSGSGDATVKVWDADDMTCLHTLVGHEGSVLALAANGKLLVTGGRDHKIKLWDMETLYCKTTLSGHEDDVLALTLSEYLFSGAADGSIRVWDTRTYQCKYSLPGHKGPVLALISTQLSHYVFSGSADNMIKVWRATIRARSRQHMESEGGTDTDVGDSLLDLLGRFVAIRTVSADPSLKDECWDGAKFLRALLERVGADAKLVEGAEGRNPLVFARLGTDPSRATILYYGHYDVQPAYSEDGWESHPWHLTGRNGYLYGRGVTDNKGPILAAIFAVKELLEEGILPVNVIFIFDGEEETDSAGFELALSRNMSWVKGVQGILVANTYWIGDNRPCLTYGLRGVIHMALEVTGPVTDLHAGFEGGVVHEPLNQLLHLFSQLVDKDGRVTVPGFYDDVRGVTPREEALYDDVEFDLDTYKNAVGASCVKKDMTVKELLMNRWRFPTLTVHGVEGSLIRSDLTSAIPRRVVGKFSMRIVPDQDVTTIVSLVTEFLRRQFEAMNTGNVLNITTKHTGDWWLGNPGHGLWRAAERAIVENWGEQPIYIREGGTLPLTAFLERTLNAPVILLPLGQASDAAHLPNERLRLENLFQGKQVIKTFLREAAKLHENPETPSPRC